MEKVMGVIVFFAVVAALLMHHPPFGGAAPAAAATSVAGNNCTTSCGNISIRYPFGIELGCYHAIGFNLTCNHSYDQPKLFLGDGTVQVLDISVENSTVRINSTAVKFQYDDGSGRHRQATNSSTSTWGLGLPRNGPYFLSESTSMLQVMGCDIQVSIRGGVNNSLVISSCTAICPSGSGYRGFIVGAPNGNCAGIFCCQTSIVLGYSFYSIQMNLLSVGPQGPNIPPSVYIVDQIFNADHIDMVVNGTPKALPATLDWIINNSTCLTNITAPECLSTHSYCKNSSSLGHGGYTCQCEDGYRGNPYVHGGCQDIDECKYPEKYSCYGGVCRNIPGSFICQCNTGYAGNAYIPNGCTDIDECKHKEAYLCYGICQNFQGSFHCECPEGTSGNFSINGGCITIKNSFIGLSIIVGVGGGLTLLLLALSGPFIMSKIRRQRMKRIFFKQNHGLLLQQLISKNANISERMIITLRQLELATDNFNRDCVVGGGGHGIVFKGNLDTHVVAIKKSKIVVQREIDEFINEVVILSQVNHRNVVKFLGCCLETAVPLLVYEYISNGTLYHHLHVQGPISVSWDDRLRIALEVAKALSYLHSEASMPIFHRDIKSSNILLDDSLTAKVSDFGASRYIPIDQTGVTTAVQGTIGYLDPMYYTTGRLTDKSDVFSFGVLLIELLTRKKPFVHMPEYRGGLVSYFTTLLTERNFNNDIMDHQVMEEENGEVQEVAALAVLCTKMKGEDRPTMRHVEMTLENLLDKRKQQVPCHTTQRRYDDDETVFHYMCIERANQEASRQYTMEEEILMSSSYPR